MIKDDKESDQILSQEQFLLVTNQTPFYGESGGQMGDIGIIEGVNCKVKVLDTKKYLGKIIAHICVLESGSITIHDNITLTIDTDHRQQLRNNHSATHILHAALKNILGTHISQRGSLVSSKRLRFDISHNSAISPSVIIAIENEVNKIILANHEVHTVLMSTEDAIQNGATALFGEKYDDEVRVVSIGNTIDNANPSYSVELCGGTHVKYTGEIGLFKIVSESAISAGVRRIEAVTGNEVLEYLRAKDSMIQHISEVAKSSENEVISKLENIIQSKLSLEKNIAQLQEGTIVFTNDDISRLGHRVKDIVILGKIVKDMESNVVRNALQKSISSHPNMIGFILLSNNNKISLILSVGKKIHQKTCAKDLIQHISHKLLGHISGGGSNYIAQTGGLKSLNSNQIIEYIKHYIEQF